jgi:hypothetical protein
MRRRSRCEADVFHDTGRQEEHRHQHTDPHQEGHTECRDLGYDAPQDGATEHGDAGHHLAAAEDRLERTVVGVRTQGVHQPRLDGAGEKREPEADEHGDECPRPERRLELPHEVVEERRAGQREGAEEVGRAPAHGVGDDTGRHLEQHHASGEEGVSGKCLEVAQTGVEKEERVDAPDERGREGVAEDQGQIDALDLAGVLIHGGTTVA